MTPIRELAGAAAIASALLILPMAGAALAHGEAGENAAEFQTHLDEYAGDINDMIDAVKGIVADYEPGQHYADDIEALTEQWETVEFHEAVEDNAMPLYPPIWAAIGAFSTALKEGAPAETVEARGDDIAAALWQGYGGLKLLATRKDNPEEHERAQAGGVMVIDTIHKNLDQVLALYKDGQSDTAQKLIYDTYMNYFEGIEGDLIEQNAELVSGLEADFNAGLPQLIQEGAPASKVAAQIDAMQADLGAARELLASAEKQESSVF